MRTLTEAVEAYFDQLIEVHPVYGTYFGLSKCDGKLGLGGRAAVEQEIAITRLLQDSLDDLEALPLERDLARYFTEISLFALEEQRNWAGMVEGPETIGTGVFLVLTRNNGPMADRLASIASRLEAAPAFLMSSRELLIEPVDLWCRLGIQTMEHLPGLLDAVIAASVGDPSQERIATAVANTKSALGEQIAWVRDEVLPRARPEHWLGSERFEKLLRLRRLPGTGDEILALGRRYLEEVSESRRELMATHWPGLSREEVEAQVKADHADSFPAALDQYRDCLNNARAFIRDTNLATVLPDESLEVVETPAFLRPVIPFAAYEPAGYFEQHQQGIYLVTPPGDPRLLSERNRSDILNTSVHEGYPGHHLQFTHANRNPSLITRLAGLHATEFVEGWAHYCEQLMYEQGFSRTPEVRFVQLTDLIWRAVRIIVDVELSRGTMAAEAAVAMLVDIAGLNPDSAKAEVNRYTYTPGYQLSYLYGKHLLLDLRAQVEAKQGDGFRLRDFHDRLLGAGALPAEFWPQLFDL